MAGDLLLACHRRLRVMDCIHAVSLQLPTGGMQAGSDRLCHYSVEYRLLAALVAHLFAV